MEKSLETSKPNLNEVYKNIHSHKSVRSYKSDPVPENVLNRILLAGTRASSSGNMQAYSIIVIKSKELKEELYAPHFNQKMVLEAPLLLTFCADFRRMKKWLKLRSAPQNFENFMSFMIGAIDSILVSQNVALAAESEGLGICYMGTTLASCFEISKILKCPPGVVPVVGFSMGYPNEAPSLRDRLPIEGIVHYDIYNDPSDQKILEIYKQREIDGWNRYMSDPKLKKKILESNVENLAQVYTKVKYTKESHEEYSKNVFRCLKIQGFI